MIDGGEQVASRGPSRGGDARASLAKLTRASRVVLVQNLRQRASRNRVVPRARAYYSKRAPPRVARQQGRRTGARARARSSRGFRTGSGSLCQDVFRGDHESRTPGSWWKLANRRSFRVGYVFRVAKLVARANGARVVVFDVFDVRRVIDERARALDDDDGEIAVVPRVPHGLVLRRDVRAALSRQSAPQSVRQRGQRARRVQDPGVLRALRVLRAPRRVRYGFAKRLSSREALHRLDGARLRGSEPLQDGEDGEAPRPPSAL